MGFGSCRNDATHTHHNGRPQAMRGRVGSWVAIVSDDGLELDGISPFWTWLLKAIGILV